MRLRNTIDWTTVLYDKPAYKSIEAMHVQFIINQMFIPKDIRHSKPATTHSTRVRQPVWAAREPHKRQQPGLRRTGAAAAALLQQQQTAARAAAKTYGYLPDMTAGC